MAIINGTTGDDTLTGTVGDDTLNGLDGNDNLWGGAGHDSLDGGNGNDSLYGEDGNDTLIGGAGADNLKGGAGDDSLDGGANTSGYDFDFANYDDATSAVQVNLALGTATGGSVGNDTLIGIEGVNGSAFDDLITGGGTEDWIMGGAGNDTIDGGAGNDFVNYDSASTIAGVNVNLLTGVVTGGAGNDVLSNIEHVKASIFNDTITGNAANNYLQGKTGDDIIDGGAGFDRAAYESASGGVTVSLVTNTSSGADGNDTLIGIENLRGSNFADSLTGDAGPNSIQARSGDDLVYGGDGNDTLEGESGNDTLFGQQGSDTLDGGAGDDTIDGGVILDRINYTDLNFVRYTSATAGVSINLSGITGDGSVGQGTATGDASVGTDILRNANFIQGSSFNDSFTGSSAVVFEQIEGGAGNDTLDGGAITDTLNYDNSNRVSYQNATGAGVTVDFIAGTAVGAGGSNVGSDTLANFNQARGSAFSDTLLGSDRTDVTEFFEGRDGNDAIDGRGGFDLARYDFATAGVTANLVTGTATGAGVGTDTLTSIEGLQGSSFDDNLIGGNAASGVSVLDGLSEYFRGGAGNDTIDGGQGYDLVAYNSSTAGVAVVLNDTLDGSASDGLGGTDVLKNIEGVRGSEFNDTLTGSNSAVFESFEGLKGNDTINGQGGVDRVDYQRSRSGVTVNLTTGTASDGEGGTDTLSNIEDVRGSRDFNDVITGSAADNKLEGLGGNDTISGLGGADTLIGGAGNDALYGGPGDDSIDGGADYDFVYYSDATGAVTVNLLLGTASGAGVGNDTLVNIEYVVGSPYGDTLIAGGGTWGLFGEGGNDSITGSASGNYLDGGDGNDSLVGGDGWDDFLGGLGDDFIDGGADTDWTYYYDAISGVTVSLLTGAVTGGAGNDTIVGIENVNGSSYPDSLTGDSNSNTLYGDAGNDTLVGGAGGDSFWGGLGDDSIDGGADTDRAEYTGAASGVTVSLLTGAATGGAGNDTLVGIENLYGSSYADSLTGDGNSNSLVGRNGNDTLVGGAGGDILWGGLGDDLIDGGADYDSVQYTDHAAISGVSISLLTGVVSGGSGNDTLVGIEIVTGSDFPDNVTGDGNNNTLYGNAGNDTLVGGAGNDYLSGGLGDDVIDGGADWDEVQYTYSISGVTVSLLTGAVTGGDGNDTLAGIENVQGSSYADSLTGDGNSNNLYGNDGNDTLVGGAGSDYFTGGLGDDFIDGGADIDTAQYYDAISGVTVSLLTGAVTGGSGNDTLVGIENVDGSSYADSLTGDALSNYLYGNGADDSVVGGAGNDTLDGGLGNDTLDGGADNDTANYSTATGAVTINLALGTASGSGVGADTLISIESLYGSQYDDALTGDTNDNTLDGGKGNDTLAGDAGNDTLIGGKGNDTLIGGAGADNLKGGAGDDSLDGGANTAGRDFDFALYDDATSAVQVNLLLGTASGGGVGNDTLVGIEGVTGSAFDDLIVGGATEDWITGGAGNDTIDGGAGNDFVSYDSGSTIAGVNVNLLTGLVTGGAGNDVLSNVEYVWGSAFGDFITGNAANNFFGGLAGDDTIDGGAGTDRASYQSASGSVTVSLVTNTSSGADGNDTLIGIENLRGSNFADSLTGDAGPNSIQARSGDDLVYGGDGNDTLEGESGNDTLFGQQGSDTLDGGAGDDTIDGGVILDRINYTDLNFVRYTSATAGVSINLSGITGDGSVGQGTATGDASVGTDILRNANFIQGSSFNDSFTGSSAVVFEQIEGGAGNDTLDGGAITDTLNYDNSNRVSYQNATGAGVTVDFIAGTAVGAGGSNVGSDTLANFNQARGSAFSDTLLGSDRTDVTEFFEGRDGNDAIDGRGGFDLARYDFATAGVTANLVTGTATGAGVGTDTLTSIEGLQGSSFDDNLIGGNAASGVSVLDGLSEYFRGGAGNDTIDGGQGYDLVAYNSSTAGVAVVLNDTLDGSASDGLGGTDVLKNIEGVRGSEFNDTLTGSNSAVFESFEGLKGNDTINGQGGVDRVDYQRSRSGVTVNLTTGTASDGEGGTDTLSNIEDVRGSRDFNDVITGSAADNKLEGLAGNDTLDGGLGNDTLAGGDGNDSYYVDSAGDSVTETNAVLATGGADRIYSPITWTLGANVEYLFLTGASSTTAVGNALNNYLEGNAALNYLSGGIGADTMSGADGNDTYYVDDITDVVLETNAVLATGGLDTVVSSVSYTLGANLENLLLSGAGSTTAVGNALNNYLEGNAALNYLSGGIGADTMKGNDGNDTYYVDDIADVVIETNAVLATGGLDTVVSSVSYTLGANLENLLLSGAGSTTAVGNALNNYLEGNAALNYLSGGIGADTMKGNDGNDTYYVDDIADVVLETNAVLATGGLDTVVSSVSYTLGANLENLLLSGAGSTTAVGNALNNYLEGNAALNYLSGGIGADTMKGNDGNDTYYVDDIADVVIETNAVLATGGLDTVVSSVSYTLGANLENLLLSGAGSITGIGNAVNNYMEGNAALNYLSGGLGADTMKGNDGNDTYYVDDIGDVVIETNAVTATGGTDVVSAAISYTLGANLENLLLSGASAINGAGNTLSNYMAGNAAANTLLGLDGNDTLAGGDGSDTLTGGLGADTFDFNALSESLVGASRDVISDFSSAQGDRVDLSTLDADANLAGNQAFSYIGAAAFSAAGQVRLAGDILSADTDGDGIADMEIQLLGVASLVVGDFVL